MATTDRGLVQNWKIAGPLLEEIRREELRSFDHEKHAKHIDDLLAFGLLHATPRPTSGMVEMQRIFARARR